MPEKRDFGVTTTMVACSTVAELRHKGYGVNLGNLYFFRSYSLFRIRFLQRNVGLLFTYLPCEQFKATLQ